jgi:hypothetical protein
VLALSAAARAEIIYDNSDTGGTNVYYTTFEYGDEILLGGTSRVMSQFLFEYYGDFTPVGDETARLRVYKADGPLTAEGDPTPGTILYDSGFFDIAPGWQTKRVSNLDVTVPTDLVWTIEFGGLAGITGDRAGLVFRPVPSVGRSFDDIWQRSGEEWQLWRFGGSPRANFASRIISGEPTVVSIRRDTNKIIVEWTGLSVLQVSDDVAGPYIDIPSARNRFEMNPGAAEAKFWRLRD